MSGQLIQERLQELQPYVKSIRYFEGLPVVEVEFDEKWAIPESQYINKEPLDEGGNTFMFFSKHQEIGIDHLLDYAEEIIAMNREREMKNQLFKVKIKELQKFFNDNSLHELEGMRFVLGKQTPSTNEDDFDPNDINFDDEIEGSTLEPEVAEVTEPVKQSPQAKKPTKQPAKKPANNVQVIKNVELPPKDSNGKVELQGDLIPAEAKDGPCDCGPEEACIKCMDDKSL